MRLASAAFPRSRHESLRWAAALVVASAILAIYGWNQRPPEDFALRADDVHTHELVAGLPLTSTSIAEIPSIISTHAAHGHKFIAWYGNSQLHTINQQNDGDHLAPYWLYEKLDGRLFPIGMSLPNANLQELYVLSTLVVRQARPQAIVISLVFDDLREDGLRGDFLKVARQDLESALGGSQYGRELQARLADEAKSAGASEGSVLAETHQQRLENSLDSLLTDTVPIWAKRPTLRATLFGDLYRLRNQVFSIKATTIRRLIPPTYARNMQALKELLADARREGIPVLAYIAPLRPGVSPPYDLAEYAAWKSSVETMVRSFGASFVNLENTVPKELWGTYQGDDIDFMHFQGPGHKLLAQAIYLQVRQLSEKR
jgi:hypothetical protein